MQILTILIEIDFWEINVELVTLRTSKCANVNEKAATSEMWPSF